MAAKSPPDCHKLRMLRALMRHVVAFTPRGSLLGPCWHWTGALTPKGYARVRDGRRLRRAHIVAWEVCTGPVPPGKVLDHLCRNRRCVNPSHLEPLTSRQNTLRGIADRRRAGTLPLFG